MASDKDSARETPGTTRKDVRPATQPTIKWDDSNMRSSYANFCNVSSTREEMVLLFGLNQAWNVAQREVPIQLTERIILSPHAAKRLAAVLNTAVREHESRWGILQTDVPRAGESAAGK